MSNDQTVVIKKYANRRLYNTDTSTYVTLEDLAEMVRNGDNFIVNDAKSGHDITHSVLTQIIFEQEAKTGNTLLPISFLRQLIAFYGDQMQMVVPGYLEHSISALTEQQEKFKEQITKSMDKNPIMANMKPSMQMVEEQVKRNTEMFHKAMSMFSPFDLASGETHNNPEPDKADNSDIDELKAQLKDLQNKVDKIS